MKKQEEQLQELLQYLDSLSYVPSRKIPDIDLYMDQVTTFMDEHLSNTKRYAEDKVLTKTMINNYAKNNLLPPPVKKRYSKQHMLMLIFIYYFKNMLSLTDIEELFRPITQKHFSADSTLSLEDIYQEVFSLEKEQKNRLKEDLEQKFQAAQTTFSDVPAKDQEYLQLFSFICELGFDIYLKKQMMEQLIDQMRAESAEKDRERKKK